MGQKQTVSVEAPKTTQTPANLPDDCSCMRNLRQDQQNYQQLNPTQMAGSLQIKCLF